MAEQIIYPPDPMFWKAIVQRVHDGDTVSLSIDLNQKMRGKDRDLGLHVNVMAGRLCLHNATRLFGINAPELTTSAGKLAQQQLSTMLPDGLTVTLRTWLNKSDKYGRVLGAITCGAGGLDINQWMVESGYALLYYGIGKKPV